MQSGWDDLADAWNRENEEQIQFAEVGGPAGGQANISVGSGWRWGASRGVQAHWAGDRGDGAMIGGCASGSAGRMQRASELLHSPLRCDVWFGCARATGWAEPRAGAK